MFLDEEAVPTLVEVKRSSDTRIRREVVGQMLDYAANAVVYWPAEHLRGTFEATVRARGDDPEALVREIAGEGDDAVELFWQRAATNLQAGRVRLVFVADCIPAELRRVIEFLNGQMQPAEVLGVEVKQYVGPGLRTLVPRVIGQTAEAEQRKAKRAGSVGREWTWERYAERVPAEQLRLIRTLFDQAAAAINERGLAWAPRLRNSYIAFQRYGGYNVVSLDVHATRTPSVMIKVPKPLDELGIANPYPNLHTFWQPQYSQVGWNVHSEDEIPDLGLAVEITRRYQPAAGIAMSAQPIAPP